MRKVLLLVLVTLMLFSVCALGFSASAACNCPDHVSGACHCCLECPNLDYAYVTPCAKTFNGTEYALTGSVCCSDCRGVHDGTGNCGCSCSCCKVNDDGSIGEVKPPVGGFFDDIWGEEEQESFVAAFQKVLARISEKFDNFFNAIFEFLRLDEVLGRN